jgi:hypothetical protein
MIFRFLSSNVSQRSIYLDAANQSYKTFKNNKAKKSKKEGSSESEDSIKYS